MGSKASYQYSEQEKAIIVASCGELEGVLAGVGSQYELKVVPAYLWEEMTGTIDLLKERCSQLENENDILKRLIP